MSYFESQVPKMVRQISKMSNYWASPHRRKKSNAILVKKWFYEISFNLLLLKSAKLVALISPYTDVNGSTTIVTYESDGEKIARPQAELEFN